MGSCKCTHAVTVTPKVSVLANVTTAASADKVVGTLTVGEKVYNGSTDVTLDFTDLATVDVTLDAESTNLVTNAAVTAGINAVQTAADNAQSSANSAASAAATAQSTAEDAQDAADAAQSTADTAVTNAATAQSTADDAASAASAAQSTADTAQLAAETAQSGVDSINDSLSDTTVKGTYSSVSINAAGVVVSGAQLIEVWSSGQTSSDSLAVGGIAFVEV